MIANKNEYAELIRVVRVNSQLDFGFSVSPCLRGEN